MTTNKHIPVKARGIHRDPALITAQIACEAVANNPTAYSTSDIEAVLHTAEYAGVSDMYTEALKAHRSQAWFDEAYAGE